MSRATAIEWTDETWNPVRGCALVSAGCANCYAMKQAHRFSGEGMPYEGLTELGPQGPRWTGKIKLVPEVLDAPLRWRKPKRIFVNSMSDLFHEEVPEWFIESVFVIMTRTPRHTYQILTKRPERMRDFMQRNSTGGRIFHLADDRGVESGVWPRPNIWLGVSVEDQQTADERIPILLQTPAAIRFVSAEPLLGPVDLEQVRNTALLAEGQDFLNVLKRYAWTCTGAEYYDSCGIEPGLDWVIVGGESGPGARLCDVAWIRSIVEQCRAAAVPVFVKQLGGRPTYSDPDHSIESDGWPDHVRWDTRRVCIQLSDNKGGDPAEWPKDLRVREMPR